MGAQETIEQYFLSRVLWWRNDLDKLDLEAISQLVKVLSKTKKDILNALLLETKGIASITDWNRDRLLSLDQWLDEVLSGAQATITGTIIEAGVVSATASLSTYNSILSFEGRASAVRTVGMTTEQIRTWFQDNPLTGDTPLSAWVNKAFGNIKEALLSSLQQSGVEGRGTAKAVKDLISAAVDAGGKITERDAVTLARTYIQTANVQAQQAVYEANRHLLKGVKRCATLDNRTCVVCAALDGRIYTFDEQRPPLPSHFRCRCAEIPVPKSFRDLGINIDDIEEVARPWVVREPGDTGAGGKKIRYAGTTKENFSGWWETLTPEVQSQSVGAVRADLLRKGLIQWGDLVDSKTGRYRTLKELGFDKKGDL